MNGLSPKLLVLAASAWMLAAAACGGSGVPEGRAPSGQDEAAEYYERGVQLNAEGRWRAAVEEFDQAIALDPGVAAFFVGRSEAHEMLGDFTQALADLDEAIRREPEHGLAYFRRGNLHQTLGEPDLARSDYAKALSYVDDPYLRSLIAARLEGVELANASGQ